MDKGLEKINILINQLNQKKQDLKKIELELNDMITIYKGLDLEKKRLEDEKEYYNSAKTDYEYKKNNIMTWKKQTIKLTSFLIVILEALFISIFVGLGETYLIPILEFNVIALPLVFSYGECGDYYNTKKFLRTFNVKVLDEYIISNERELNQNKEALKEYRKIIEDISQNKNELENQIEFISKQIGKSNTIRNKIINNYIQNNAELDALINNEFEEVTEEEKQLTNKKKKGTK